MEIASFMNYCFIFINQKSVKDHFYGRKLLHSKWLEKKVVWDRGNDLKKEITTQTEVFI